jgi:uncharacterized protein YbaR (Trm112 family)
MICSMDVFRLRSDVMDLSAVVCPDCRDLLTIHQPDERLPDRLIGICDGCPSWFLIELNAATMLRLPDEGALRAARSA